MCDPDMKCESGRSAPTRVVAVTGLQVQKLLWKLEILMPCLPQLPRQVLRDDFLLADKQRREQGKHALQEASIIGHLLANIGNLEEAPVVAIELGAGTGRLSDRLQRVTGAAKMTHVLVDRQAFKPLALHDRHMKARIRRISKNQDENIAIQRFVGDIALFNFDDIKEPPTTQQNNEDFDERNRTGRICCISKHLCGPACDLAIETLSRTKEQPPCCCCFATCCHYLCTWENFVGREFWMALGLDQEDFLIAVATSQWTSMRKLPKPTEPRGSNGDAVDFVDSNQQEWLPDLLKVAQGAFEELQTSTKQLSLIESSKFENNLPRKDKIVLGSSAKECLTSAVRPTSNNLGTESN